MQAVPRPPPTHTQSMQSDYIIIKVTLFSKQFRLTWHLGGNMWLWFSNCVGLSEKGSTFSSYLFMDILYYYILFKQTTHRHKQANKQWDASFTFIDSL